MIIKSMSRKTRSFGQLMSYIEREQGQGSFRIRHNILGRKPKQILGEFEKNSHLLKERKNGTYLFHEIISITRAEGLSEDEHKIKLHKIVEDYVAARCPDNMVFGGLHADKDHSYHYHLMISSNAVGQQKRVRLSKAQFREIQVRAEQNVLKLYPELKQQLAIGKTASEKRNDRAHHVLKRGGRLTKREAIRDRLYAAWSEADDRESFIEALRDQDFTLNLKKSLSVTDQKTGLHHRIKTLDPNLLSMVEHTLGMQAPKASSRAKAGSKKEKANQDESQQHREPSSEPNTDTQTGEKPTDERSDFVRDVEKIYERKREKKAPKLELEGLRQKLRRKRSL